MPQKSVFTNPQPRAPKLTTQNTFTAFENDREANGLLDPLQETQVFKNDLNTHGLLKTQMQEIGKELIDNFGKDRHLIHEHQDQFQNTIVNTLSTERRQSKNLCDF